MITKKTNILQWNCNPGLAFLAGSAIANVIFFGREFFEMGLSPEGLRIVKKLIDLRFGTVVLKKTPNQS